MKEFKSNINYFTRWQGMRTLSAVLGLGGFAAMWVGWMIHYIIMLLGAPSLVIGAVLFFVSSSNTSTESEILEEIGSRKNEIEFPELESDRALQKRIPKRAEVHEFEGYCYDGEFFKKMKNGTVCSSEYSRSVMHVLTDAFYIKSIRFSLTSDKKSDITLEIPFSSIEDIKVERGERELVGKKETYKVKECRFVLTYSGNRFEMIAGDDAYAEDLAAKLKLTARGE